MAETELSKIELVDHVLENKPVPRVPTGFWFHFLGEAESGDASVDAELVSKNIEGHRHFIKSFEPDMVKIMSDGFFLHPVKGGLDTLAEALKSIEAVGPGHPWIDRQAHLVKSVAALSPDTRRFYNIFSASTTLRFMIGREKLLAWLKNEPEATSTILKRIELTVVALAKAVVARESADGIYLSVQNPGSESFSDESYDRYLKAGELSILAAAEAAGGKNILHICGYAGIRNRLAHFKDYPAAMISWATAVEGVPLGEGKRLFGGRPVVGGFRNVPGSLIHVGDEDCIKAKTREILAESGRVGVMVGADCTVPNDIDLKRLEWVREAAAEPVD